MTKRSLPLRTSPSDSSLPLWNDRRNGHGSGSGIVEKLNYRIKLTIRKAYGFRMLEAAEIALYRALGRLPEPTFAHEFC